MILRVLVVLILVVPMLGGLNYMRNEPLDSDLQKRRFATVSDSDLDALDKAYEAQLGYVKSQIADVPEGTDLVDRYSASDVEARPRASPTSRSATRTGASSAAGRWKSRPRSRRSGARSRSASAACTLSTAASCAG